MKPWRQPKIFKEFFCLVIYQTFDWLIENSISYMGAQAFRPIVIKYRPMITIFPRNYILLTYCGYQLRFHYCQMFCSLSHYWNEFSVHWYKLTSWLFCAVDQRLHRPYKSIISKLLNGNFSLGTIHTLRQHNFGIFLTHPPTKGQLNSKANFKVFILNQKTNKNIFVFLP